MILVHAIHSEPTQVVNDVADTIVLPTAGDYSGSESHQLLKPPALSPITSSIHCPTIAQHRENQTLNQRDQNRPGETMPAVAQSAQRDGTPPHYVVCVSDKTRVAIKPNTQVLTSGTYVRGWLVRGVLRLGHV